ncbi:MAG: glycosyltransferase [Actinomycetota bacterium]
MGATAFDDFGHGMSKKMMIVHERFTEVAGSEHVVEQLSIEWPRSDIFAAVTRPEGIPKGLTAHPHASDLQPLYRFLREKSYAPLMPLMPRAFRHLPLRDADVVVASHHAFATQSVFATDAPVVAYVHSPARWAWDASLRAGEGGGPAGAALLSLLAASARRCEIAAAPRLARIVANSSAVAERVRQWWSREAVVVHPPVDTDGFTPDTSVARENFFLLAGRLVPYKRPELAIEAAKAAGVPLVVAGDGRSMERCRAAAGPSTTFLGRVSHEQLLDLHRRARALVMPGVEDFGIVPVESMATGTPVIALGEGGAMDTILPGVTGVHVESGSLDHVRAGFSEAMRTFDPSAFDPAEIRKWAEGFSRRAFREKIRQVVDAV